MKSIAMLVLAGAALLNTACSSVLSLEAAGEQSAPNPGLAGVWMAKDDDDPMIVRLEDDGTLNIRFGEMRLTGRAFRVGAAEYLDVTPHKEEAFHVPGHAVVRYWLDRDSVRWAFADSQWLQTRIAGQGVAAQKVRGTLVLTGSGGAFVKVLAEFGQDERAYGDVSEMKRVR